jgi:hypothetical protein
MGGACSTPEADAKGIKILVWVNYLKIRGHLEDSGIDENIIIRWIRNIEFERHTVLIIRTDIKETDCGVVN